MSLANCRLIEINLGLRCLDAFVGARKTGFSPSSGSLAVLAK
jgi:hypothetical protein